MGKNSVLNAAFKDKIFTMSFAPIWVIFQNSVTYYEYIDYLQVFDTDISVYTVAQEL